MLSSTGMVPVNKFVFRFRVLRLVNMLSSTGMVPVNKFLFRLRVLRLVNMLSSTGIVPLKLLDIRFLRDGAWSLYVGQVTDRWQRRGKGTSDNN